MNDTEQPEAQSGTTEEATRIISDGTRFRQRVALTRSAARILLPLLDAAYPTGAPHGLASYTVQNKAGIVEEVGLGLVGQWRRDYALSGCLLSDLGSTVQALIAAEQHLPFPSRESWTPEQRAGFRARMVEREAQIEALIGAQMVLDSPFR